MIKKTMIFLAAVSLVHISLPTQNARAQSIAGQWNGILHVYGSQLSLVLHISKTDSGYTSTLDSPDQGATGIPTKSTRFRDDLLIVKIPRIGAAYRGELQDDSTFNGTFTQRGQSFDLKLTQKEVHKKEIKRPQEPSPPYPYRSKDITFKNEQQDVTLAGTLTMPKRGGPFPAVILISGSGPQNRNEELLGHKPFLVISDYLTRRGIAALRFDDRGVGQSTGDFSSATSADFATDVEAGFRYLQNYPNINHKKIGLIGHSEGGLIAPIVAAKNKKVAFIILLAGPGLPGDQILLAQEKLIARADSVSARKIRLNRKINRKAFAIIKKTDHPDSLNKKLTAYFRQSLEKYPDVQKPEGIKDETFVRLQVKQLSSPWMRHFITYDPRPTLQKVHCPVLALDGSHDLQVPPEKDLKAIKEALKEGGNTQVTTRELQGLNHLFQQSKTGSPANYGKIEQTFSPRALKIMKDWIEKITTKN